MSHLLSLVLGLGIGAAVGAIIARRRKQPPVEVNHVYNVSGFIGDETKLADELARRLLADRPN